MIDLKYHITSLIAVFLALGVGILIGSTVVGGNVLVDQQKKMIDRLEEQFYVLKEREKDLVEENKYKNQIISNYENYSQAVLPLLVKNRLAGYRIAVVVSGDRDIPAGMLNALSIAGAEIISKTVVLSNMELKDDGLREKLADYYDLDDDVKNDTLRSYIASSVGAVIANEVDIAAIDMLQGEELVKFAGVENDVVDGVILLGGSNDLNRFFVQSFDQALIGYLVSRNIKVFGVENSEVNYSYMEHYQKSNISTIDNVDMSPGQISLIFTIEGEAGNYGVKPTAQKFMPSLPVDNIVER